MIPGQIAAIVASCKLAPAADAHLHVILSELVAGAGQMKDGDAARRRQGVARVVAALELYPRYFEDPDWRPLE